MDRKAELARKKAKLELLRQERLKKEDRVKTSPSITRVSSFDKISIDGILKELGVNDDILDIKENKSTPSSDAPNQKPETIDLPKKKLVLSGITQESIAPKTSITYAKSVQTEQDCAPKCVSPIEPWDDEASRNYLGLQSFEWDDEIGINPYGDDDPHLSEMSPFISKLHLHKHSRLNQTDIPLKPPFSRDLTEDEKQVIMESEPFQDFFMRASRVIQRALDEPNDIFIDYSGADRGKDAQGKHQMVKYVGDFFDKTCIQGATGTNRSAVVALDWSCVHPELLLAAYQRDDGLSGSAFGGSGGFGDGLGGAATGFESSFCCIWNLKYRQATPEFVFTYQMPIRTAILTEFHPSLVIGGTQGGQIVIWDCRSNRRIPVQKTRLSGSGAAHVEPICGLGVSGTRNSNSLVSVSSEGRLCTWSLDMLGAPVQILDLTPPSTSNTAATATRVNPTGSPSNAVTAPTTVKRSSNPINPTCTAFLPHLDSSRFLVGSLDGVLYCGSRHGNNAGLMQAYEGHRSPVTGVSILSGSGGGVDEKENAGPLFVSTGMDCTMRLWSLRVSGIGGAGIPLLTYSDKNDYVVDIDTSPIHPSLFATTDLSSSIDFWSLNTEHEVPTVSVQVEGEPMLNRCRFHKKGFHFAVGGDDGRIRVYELHESLAMPKPDETSKLSRLVRNLAMTAAEEFDAQNHDQRHLHHLR